MRLKNLLRTASAAFILGAAIFAADATPRRFKLGISVALTGPAATYGIDVKNFVLFSLARFPDAPIDIVLEDDKCSAKEAAAIAQKLGEIDKVDAVIGPSCTGAVLASAPIYERLNILQITPNTRATSLTDRTAWTLVANPGNVPPVDALLRYARKSISSLAVLTETTEFCKDVEEVAAEVAKTIDLDLSKYEFQSDADDLRATITRLASEKPPGLFLNVQTEASLLKALRVARELKYQGAVFALFFPGGRRFLELAGENGEGLIFSDYVSPRDEPNSESAKLYDKFVAQYGEPNSNPSGFDHTIDAAKAVVDAFFSGKHPRDYLLAPTSTMKGLDKKWYFDGRRRKDGVVVVKQIISSRPATLFKSK